MSRSARSNVTPLSSKQAWSSSAGDGQTCGTSKRLLDVYRWRSSVACGQETQIGVGFASVSGANGCRASALTPITGANRKPQALVELGPAHQLAADQVR